MKLEVEDPTFMEKLYSFEESQEHLIKRKYFESLNWRTNRSVVSKEELFKPFIFIDS